MTDDPNAALKDTLKTYVLDPRVSNHAIMLTGTWGVGKTFLVNQFLHDGIGDVKPIYVSLYGVGSRADFNNAVIAAIHPYTERKTAKVASSILTSLGGMISLKTDLSLSDIVDTVRTGLFIFDDLERIDDGLSVQSVMGYINGYVEHEGCRVIIIGNDEEMLDSTKFNKTKEKLVGRTLRVKPATREALDSYLNLVSNLQCRTFVVENRLDLVRIYKQSKVNNLRILKQALWDLEQLFDCFETRHFDKPSEIYDVVRLFFIFALEAKNGTLTVEDLLNRKTSLSAAARRRDKHAEKTVMESLNDKYPEVNVYDTTLNSEVSKAMIFDGDFSKKPVLKSLDASYSFARPEDETEWKTLWNSSNRDEIHVESAALLMEEKYAAQEYKIPGILLHVCVQRLWLSSIGFIAEAEDEIVESGKRYMDRLFAEEEPELFNEHFHFADAPNSFDGLAYLDRDTVPFKELSAYMVQRQIDAVRRSMANSVSSLLLSMKNDIQRFVMNLNPNGESESSFGKHPILADIKPNSFAETLLQLSANDQHQVFMALGNRYKSGLLESELLREKRWLTELCQELGDCMSQQSIFVRDRLEKFEELYLAEYLP